MKKLLYIATLAAITGASFSSCDDFLEAENKTAGGVTADDYFSTADGQKALRNYTFGLLPVLVNTSYISMYDDATDIYWPNRKDPSEFDLYNITIENGTVKAFYQNAYKFINNANGMLEYGGYDSDAKFLRAFGYYMLVQQFGPVPYVTSYINNASRNYPRTPIKEIYDGCLADLDDVLKDANVPDASSHDGTVSKQAANALAAKIALAAGWDLNTTLTDATAAGQTYSVDATTYFERAAAYAENALAGVTLYDEFADKWSYKNDETNQEEFFSAEYDRASYSAIADASSAGHSLQNEFGFYYGNSTNNGTKASASAHGTSVKGVYLFEKGDKRYDATFAIYHVNCDSVTRESNWGKTGYYARYNNDADLANDKSVPLAFYFAPWYTTEAEFDAFLAENAERFTKTSANGNYLVAPTATLLGNPAKIVKFNTTTGAVASTKTLAYTYESGFLSGTDGGDCVIKWDDPETQLSATSSNCYRDIQFLHASETYLTAAEAYLLAGKSAEALAYVNKIRTRAGLDALASFDAYAPSYLSRTGNPITLTPLDVVLDERARELFGEPGRWMDLRRTKQLERYYNAFTIKQDKIAAAYQTLKWLRPIPTDEINSNDAMSTDDQNAGY